MAKLNRRSISRRTVEALKVEKDTVFWDRDLPGFGIRVYASGTKTYVVQSRTKGKSVRVTVGRHGVISADEARRRAARIVNRIKAGEDPVPEPLPARLAGGPTVADLAARYMEKHVSVRCKASTAEGIRGLLGKYIVPEFGKLPLLAVERERVAAFHVRLSGVPYAANRAVALMSRMYAMAADWEMVPDGTNPCRSVCKYPARGRERFLTDTEFRRLGEVLGEAATKGGVSVHAVAAIRLLMLTGCRKSEILSLQWTDIDLEAGQLRLRESKTGPRAVPLSPPSAKVLADLPRVPGNPWVIPGQKPDTHMTNLDDPWRIVRERAGIENVRIHDCRHSFASRALALGRRQHRGGFPEGRFGNGEAARATGNGQFRVASYRGTVGPAKRRQACSLSPKDRRMTLSDAGKPGIIDSSEFVRWPVAERPVTTGKASRERIPVL